MVAEKLIVILECLLRATLPLRASSDSYAAFRPGPTHLTTALLLSTLRTPPPILLRYTRRICDFQSFDAALALCLLLVGYKQDRLHVQRAVAFMTSVSARS